MEQRTSQTMANSLQKQRFLSSFCFLHFEQEPKEFCLQGSESDLVDDRSILFPSFLFQIKREYLNKVLNKKRNLRLKIN
jgi:hypothetical protein